MKKSKIFATVVYFIFTFGIGVVFSLTLPGYFATFTVPAKVIAKALGEGDFVTGIVLAEPVGFREEPVLNQTFEEGGGIVLFETVMEVYDRDAEEGAPAHGSLYKCYEGYVFGVSDRYDVFSRENNGTSLRVTTGSGEEKTLPLLDYDENGDGKNDGIVTYKQNGFIVLEIRESDVSSVKSLRFTDKAGNTVLEAEADGVLGFESKFFDCFGDIGAYNEWVAAVNREGATDEEQRELNEKRNEYVKSVTDALGKEEGCVLTASSDAYGAAAKTVSKQANKKAIPFVILYFVAIYIIADFLLGSHYIIKFFKWFLFGVCKIPHKDKSPKEDVFGHDYYSMVTLTLDLTEVPEFHGSVKIKYTNTDGEAVFSLLKENGYTATVRLKAGVYVNPFIDIDRAYAPVDLPDNLEVEGYRTDKTIKIVKREV